jgi:hypothetical protein
MLKVQFDNTGSDASKLVDSVQRTEERAIRAETALEQKSVQLERTVNALETQKQTVSELREGLKRHSELTRQVEDRDSYRRIEDSSQDTLLIGDMASGSKRESSASPTGTALQRRRVHIGHLGDVHITAPKDEFFEDVSSSSSVGAVVATKKIIEDRPRPTSQLQQPRIHVSRRGSVTIAPRRVESSSTVALPTSLRNTTTVSPPPPSSSSAAAAALSLSSSSRVPHSFPPSPPHEAPPASARAGVNPASRTERSETNLSSSSRASSSRRRVGRTPIRMKAFRAIFEAVNERGDNNVTAQQLLDFLHSPAMSTPDGTEDAKVSAGLRVRQRFCALLTANNAIEMIFSSEGIRGGTKLDIDRFSQLADRVFMG